jgi:hypothetical protein
MSGRSSLLSHPWRVLRWAGLAAAVPAVWACTSRSLEAPVVTPTQIFSNKVTQKVNNDIDILFMIDNSSSMTTMQTKLLAQLPTFMQVLQALPMGLPSVQVAVVSSDMGAPSDQGAAGIGCSQTGGDNGNFFAVPEAPCVMNYLNSGSFFIADDAAGMSKNFSLADPAGISTVFQCIGLLGAAGCGFEHQLASIDRALGADGAGPAPAMNTGFIRDGAYLGIVMLTNEDDCSAPASGGPLPIFSLNGDNTNDINTPASVGGPPDGPIANFRCNGGPLGGHLCQDLNPNSTDMTDFSQPPINPPADAMGTAAAPILPLSNCESNESPSSGLTPVSKFVMDIKALKPDPANQILVAAVTGVTEVGGDPTNLQPVPYTVQWLPGAGPAASQLWPSIQHNCTSGNGDGSFADPAVRIAQFVHGFGSNGVLASICDNNYAQSMAAIAAKIGALITPKCITGVIQQVNGQPDCTVTNEVENNGITKQLAVPACATSNNAAPCWQFVAPGGMDPAGVVNKCTAGTQALYVSPDPNNLTPQNLDSLVQCSTCVTGISAAGCPCTGTNDVAGCI